MKQEDIEYLADMIVEGFKQGPARDLIRAQMAASIFPACPKRKSIEVNATLSLFIADQILKEAGL